MPAITQASGVWYRVGVASDTMKQGLPRVQISMMNVYISVYLSMHRTPAAFTTAYSHRVRRALPQHIVTGLGGFTTGCCPA